MMDAVYYADEYEIAGYVASQKPRKRARLRQLLLLR